MLNSITCDTDVSELISESDISGFLTSIDDEVTMYIEAYRKLIDEETTTGGLSLKAYNLGDSSPLIESCDNFIGNITLGQSFVSFKGKAHELLKEQRTKELNKLREKVSEKITELEANANSIQSQIFSLSLSINTTGNEVANLSNELVGVNNELKKYREKLSSLEGMV